MMKRYVFIFFIVSLFGMTAIAAKDGDKSVLLDRIVAVVNDEVVTQAELNQEVHQLKKHFRSMSVAIPADDVFRQQVLQQLIDKKLQLQVAKNIGISVGAGDINQEIARLAKERQMTLKDFYLEAEREGWTVDDFRQEIRHEMMIQRLQQREVVSHVKVSDEEVNSVLNAGKAAMNKVSYHLADVLIPLSETPSSAELDKAKKQAEQVVQALEKGKDFHRVTIKEGGQTQVFKGIDLTWRTISEIPSLFVSTVPSMKKGEVASPIQAPNGLHVIQLLGMKGGEVRKMIDESEVQMLFIRSIPGKEAVLKKKVDQLYRSVRYGKDFNKLARRYSEDSETAKLGGYIGWVSASYFEPEVNKVLTQLTVGEVSQPIVTDRGWTILKVLSKRQVPDATDEERGEVKRLLFQQKVKEALEKFVSDLRNESYIDVRE